MKRRGFLRTVGAHVTGAIAFGVATGCVRSRTSSTAAAFRTRNAPALNGIDVLVRQNFAPLKGLRLGLITNHTGQDRERRATIDILKNAPGVHLSALFGPEHGIRGELDEKVGDGVDQKTGLPVFSLYGERRVPTAEQLRGLDALVFDIQDIGCRFYTYISTLGLAMEAAAENRKKFIVLDRVNPINGLAIEGPMHLGKREFVAFHHVPLRHGMTVGELAWMFNAEQNLSADLTVIRAENWRRDQWFDETGLPWTNQSPNMRSLPAATLYPGVGLHEAALSVGRGTDKPFEIIGAPYINDRRLAAELGDAGLPGIRFVPIRFTPTYSTFKDKPCGGVAFVITDREELNSVDLGIVIALTLQRIYPNDFALAKVSTLLRHAATLEAIKAGKPLAEIKRSWAAEFAEFKSRRQRFLIYS